ncbi:MAG: hypothetical protein ACLTSZ_14285 [Lachnospiraceae bacterium]
MCIGSNLRSGTDALFRLRPRGTSRAAAAGAVLLDVIFMFAIGAGIGERSLSAQSMASRVIWASCILLAVRLVC